MMSGAFGWSGIFTQLFQRFISYVLVSCLVISAGVLVVLFAMLLRNRFRVGRQAIRH